MAAETDLAPIVEDNPRFHALLRELRQHSGLTYDQLAARSMTTKSYLFRLETGQARPSRDLVLRLAISLDLDVLEAEALLRASGHLGILESSRHAARHTVHASPEGSPLLPPSP